MDEYEGVQVRHDVFSGINGIIIQEKMRDGSENLRMITDDALELIECEGLKFVQEKA